MGQQSKKRVKLCLCTCLLLSLQDEINYWFIAMLPFVLQGLAYSFKVRDNQGNKLISFLNLCLFLHVIKVTAIAHVLA